MLARKTFVSIGVWILCLTGITIMAVFYNSYDLAKLPNDYSIVFDAGSSNTRMYIYQWTAGFSAAKGDKLRISETFSCNTKDGGLDKVRDLADLKIKFSNCVSRAKKIIPDSRKSRAYIFLAATAGMRLLDSKNKTASDQIFGYVREYFSALNFLYKNQSQARILSGQEEGINAWISANYFENNFDTYKNKKASMSNTNRTKGILDMGGASTQITYVPSASNPKYSQFFTQIRIYGITYSAYSHSFLCWGINQFGLLYQTLLLTINDYKTSIKASCFPKGFNLEQEGGDFLDSPCASGLVFNYTYNFTANTSRIEKNQNYSFQGESNGEMCEIQMKQLLPKPACPYDSCSFDGVYQPTLESSNFLGFSNIFYAISNTAKLFKLKVTDINLTTFQNLTDFICRQNFQELKDLNSTNNAGLNDAFLSNQCFANKYVTNLLTSYGFTSFDQITMTDKINGFSLNWALGYMINELNRDDFLPYEEPPRKLNLSIFVIFTIIFSLVCLISLIYVLYPKIKTYFNKRNAEEIPFSRKRNDQTDAKTVKTDE